MSFGVFIKNERLRRNLSLRDIAKGTGLDLAYLSRLEREIIKPPTKRESIEQIAKILELDETGTQTLVDYAAIDQKRIPDDIEIAPDSLEALPLLLRTIGNEKLSKSQIAELSERVKSLYR